MMNKSLRASDQESSHNAQYGFQPLVIPGRPRSCAVEPGIQSHTHLWIPGSREGARPGMTVGGRQKKSRRFRRLLKLITGRRQTEWTGATRCPNKDDEVIAGKA